MIYKVLYQENRYQVPVRENTKSLYVEAETEREARKKIADRDIVIEVVLPVTDAFLEYEQLNEDFKVEQI